MTRNGAATPWPLRTWAGIVVAGLAGVSLLFVGLRSATSPPGPSSTSSAPPTPAPTRPPVAGGVLAPPRSGPAPGVRQAPASAVDPTTGLTLFWGGIAPVLGSGVDLGDTWTWRDGAWTEHSAAAAPAPRHGAVMAPYPAVTLGGPDHFLLVGGTHAGVDLHDSWLWTASGWQALGGAEPAGTAVAVAADYPDGTAVLVTRGADGGAATYVRGGGGWVDMHVATPAVSLLAGDPRLGVVGLALTPGELAAPARTWRWTGSDWRAVNPPTEPGVEVLTATLAPAPGAGLLLAEVNFLDVAEVHGGTWMYDGHTWRHAQGPVPDFLRAFDSTTPVWGLHGTDPVLIGGSAGADAYRQVIRWDGRAWTPL